MRRTPRAALISAIGLFAACSSPDADLQKYCAARGERSLGEACSPTQGCCSPYQCEASRCCAPAGQTCAQGQCCGGLFCVDDSCSQTPPKDGGADAATDAGRDAGSDAGGGAGGGGGGGGGGPGFDAGDSGEFDAGPFDAGDCFAEIRSGPQLMAGACSGPFRVDVVGSCVPVPDGGPPLPVWVRVAD